MPRPIFHKTMLLDITYIPLLNFLLNPTHVSFAIIWFYNWCHPNQSTVTALLVLPF